MHGLKRSGTAVMAVVGLVAWILVFPLNVQSESSSPNIVLVMVDDLGWTGFSGYGSDLHRTPHIDGLAEESMKFTNAYASAPICTPTRASLMTGKYPARLNMTIWHEMARTPQRNRRLIPPVVEGNLPHEEVTLAEVLREAGYRTGHVGKWHLGEASHYPETHGFDYSFGGSFWGAPPTFHFPYRGTWGSGTRAHPRYIPGVDAREERDGEYLTYRLTDEALSFIGRAAGEPFFLYLSYYTVHTPIEGKPEVAARYAGMVDKARDHRNAHYAAMHEALDDNVARLLETLESEGLAENTAVFITSDNGGFINLYDGQTVTSNRPLRSGKGSLYEGGVRVPLIVHWPGVTQAGSVSAEPVATMDLYPTILDMVGLPNREGQIDGSSFVRLLRNPQSKPDPRSLYWHYPHYYATTTPASSVLRGKWKLLEYFEDGRVELYDLDSDLGESHNLAEVETDVARELKRSLSQWRSQVNASLPQINPNWNESE